MMARKPETLGEAFADIGHALGDLRRAIWKRIKDQAFALEYKFWAFIASLDDDEKNGR